MKDIISILHIEDEVYDAELIKQTLAKGGINCTIHHVETLEEFEKVLSDNETDLILSDYKLPSLNGIDILNFARSNYPEIPFIFVSGTIGEEAAIESLLKGATDYVLKDKLSRLVPAVNRTLRELEERLNREKAEKALQEVEKEKTVILDSVTELVVYHDLDLTIKWANKAALNEIKKSKPGTVNKGCYLQLFQKVDCIDNCPVKDSIKSGKTEQAEISSPDGRTWIVTAQPTRDSDNKLIGVVETALEITERKKADEQLRKLSRAVEQSPVSIVITDTDGLIEYANPKSSAATGYKPEEVIGQNPRIFKSGELTKSYYKKMWETLKSGKEWIGEFHNRKKNGELFWELASISPITDQNGKITHFVAIKEDITERKLMEKNLVEAKQGAEKSDKLKSEFLAQMSHEIRTPLNTLLSYSQLIEEEVENYISKDLRVGFHILKSSGQRIMRTINLILNMSEIQTGTYEYNPKTFDVYNDILKKLHSEFFFSAQKKNLELNLLKETEETILTTDEYSFSQIFNNLIDNAIKYTDKGKVEIKVYKSADKNLCIDVKDTGVGIAAEFQHNLFKPFSQEEQGYTRKYDGNGLGLALVKKYCDLNNAEIIVSSTKGKGSTFTVICKNENK